MLTSDLDINKIGEYLITYTVINGDAIKKTVARSVIVVAEKITNLEFSKMLLKGSHPIYLRAGDKYIEYGVSIIDEIEYSEVSTSGTVEVNKTGMDELTYSTFDSIGKKNSVVTTIIVSEREEIIELEVNLNNGLEKFIVSVSSPLLGLVGTEMYYLITTEQPVINAEWKIVRNVINLPNTLDGNNLYILVRNGNSDEIIKLDNLNQYQEIKYTDERKITYKINGKETNLEKAIKATQSE